MVKGNGHDAVAATIGGKPLDEAIEVCADHLRIIKPLLEQRRTAYLATERVYHIWLSMHSKLDRQRAENSKSTLKRIGRSDVQKRANEQKAGMDLNALMKAMSPEQLGELLAKLEGMR